MYNPFPFHDPKPVNRPELSHTTIDSIVAGNNQLVAKRLMEAIAAQVEKEGAIVAFDGYTTTKWDLLVSLLARECDVRGFQVEFVDSAARPFKSGDEIDALIDPLLIWDKAIDPTLLYGKVYHGGYIGLMDPQKVAAFQAEIPGLKAPGTLVIVYGYGSLIREFRPLYDVKCWFDITPMNSMLRIRAGEYANIGKKHSGIINRTIRRCYYCDFENAVQLRRELFDEGQLDWFFLDNDRSKLQMMPFSAFADICAQLVKYPFRAKPVYLEGVWGGTYMKKLRQLPDEMRNCAWIFDFIPMEVSVLVEAGAQLLDISYCSFVHKEGVKLMDDNFNENFYLSRQNDLIRGAYHFFVPGADARRQAEFYLHQVHLEPGDLIPVLDVEKTGNLTPQQLRRDVKTWLDIVERKYGVKPMLYTSYKFKLDYLGTPEFDAYPYWIAHYYVEELEYKGKWAFWQHTDCGKVSGIQGFVDCNIFNGTLADLMQFTLPEPE